MSDLIICLQLQVILSSGGCRRVGSQRLVVLVLDDPRINKNRYLSRKPRGKAQAECVGDPKTRAVLGPKGLEMNGQTDLSATIHLHRIKIESGSKEDDRSDIHQKKKGEK